MIERRIARLLILSQVSFFGFLAVCILLIPEGLAANRGISFYGAHPADILPLGLGFLTSSYFLLQAARTMPSHTPAERLAIIALRLMTVLIIGVLITPYSLGYIVDVIHTIIGAALFILQLAMAIWLLAVIVPDWQTVALLVTQLAGGFISLFSLINILPFLIQGQILFQVAFGLLLTTLTRSPTVRSWDGVIPESFDRRGRMSVWSLLIYPTASTTATTT